MRLADRYTRPSLNRKVIIRNRVRNINEETMKNLDIIYDAIAQDKKISYKYFKYRLNNQNPKEYRETDSSKILTTSPYEVSWDGNQFMVSCFKENPRTSGYLELEHMEQIKILEDKRDVQAIAQRQLEEEHVYEETCQNKIESQQYLLF